MGVRKALTVYQPVLFFVVAAFVVLSASRLALVIWQWARVSAVDGGFFVMLQGLRFDAIVICAVVFIPALLCPFLSL